MVSGFFTLLDDIATWIDDMATMSKVAAKKTAGILDDDLALNAKKSSGSVSSLGLPELWSISKGSFLNKEIILPIAFLLSAFLPVTITIILILGGWYLAYNGAKKIYEFLVPHAQDNNKIQTVNLSKEEILAVEKEKIKSAIVTAFILSIQSVIIALGTFVQEDINTQITVTTIIGILATVGVYNIVAFNIRMDDFGAQLIALNDRDDSFSDKVGNVQVRALPYVIKSLTVIGTFALILVAGGIFVHNIHFSHEFIPKLPMILQEFVVELIAGAVALAVFN